MAFKSKEAQKAYERAWQAANPDKRKAYRRAWDLKNRDKINAAMKKWVKANPEKIRVKNKRQRLAKPDATKAQIRRWQKAHPENMRQKDARRRARKAGAPVNDFTAAQWRAMKQHYESRCVYCQRKMLHLTQDHITPLSKGGSHTYSNIVPACQPCNRKKGTGEPLVPVQPLLCLETETGTE